MAELTMLADIQRPVYPEKVTCQLHVMAQDRESSLVIDPRSNHSAATPPMYTGWPRAAVLTLTSHQCIYVL